MSGETWRDVPVGLDAQRWVTRGGCRAVLAVVHTVASGQRLMDAVRLLEDDLRIQVVFTAAPDVFSNGVAEFLSGVDGAVIGWQQAIREEFDLALAASYGSLHQLHAPLVVMPHGASFNKLVTSRERGGATVARAAYGLERQRLVHDGTVVASAIVLAHDADLIRLGRECPEAQPVASVAGDPAYDRLLASLRDRGAYRRALGVTEDQKLVVVTSTWGPRSLFSEGAVLPRLVDELSGDTYKVAALIHPNAWFTHGPWQMRAWLADRVRRGLRLVPPEADWRAVLAAADLIVGDHGSLALYGAAVGIPVVLAGFCDRDIDPFSASALLAMVAPRLRPDVPLPVQVRAAEAGHRAEHRDVIAARLTSQPGRFNANMRRLMYRLLRLRQPATIPATEPAAAPFLVG